MIPRLLALDFDGVICNGLREYFQTAWRAYAQIWHIHGEPPAGLAEVFYRLRPVVETGWEMPVLLYALQSSITETEIFAHWPTLVQILIQKEQLVPSQIAAIVDGLRDVWIAQDLKGWLALHEFYPGVPAQLAAWLAADIQLVIISTKEGRFIQQLLTDQGVVFPTSAIFGKETKQPKYVTLRHLQQTLGVDYADIWFIEDRLATLQQVRSYPDLQAVRLFLAAWGYNTSNERASAPAGIRVLSLETFRGTFTDWIIN
jgi:phosphoglycolate phosphatase-like HAD superfamily hydrolase